MGRFGTGCCTGASPGATNSPWRPPKRFGMAAEDDLCLASYKIDATIIIDPAANRRPLPGPKGGVKPVSVPPYVWYSVEATITRKVFCAQTYGWHPCGTGDIIELGLYCARGATINDPGGPGANDETLVHTVRCKGGPRIPGSRPPFAPTEGLICAEFTTTICEKLGECECDMQPGALPPGCLLPFEPRTIHSYGSNNAGHYLAQEWYKPPVPRPGSSSRVQFNPRELQRLVDEAKFPNISQKCCGHTRRYH